MPTYEYLCKKCKHMFELFQSMNDEPCKTCSECKGPVRRLVSGGTGLIFKGSGFYLTDYKKNGKKTSTDKKEVKKELPSKNVKKEK